MLAECKLMCVSFAEFIIFTCTWEEIIIISLTVTAFDVCRAL